MASQCMKQIRTVEEFKQFIWTFISDTFSAVRVDVVHKQRNVSLSQLVKRSPFGKDIPYEFMVFLRRAFLPGGRSVAVEQACAQISLTVILDGSGVREFTSIIREDQRHEGREPVRPEFQIQAVKNIDHGLGIVGIPEKSKHQFCLDKVEGQENFPALFPFHRIHLRDRQIRVSGTMIEISFIGTPGPAGLIDLELFCFSAPTVADFPREVDIPGLKYVVVNETVKGALTDHKRVPVVGTDMVERLAAEDERGDNGVQPTDILFGIRDAGPGFRKQFPILLMCIVSGIKMFFQGAGAPVRAAVADIRRH